MKIAFIHPDLGIGGAERLIVDAGVGLQKRGHDVTMLTSHCDKSHCFDEVADGTLKVEVLGGSLFPTNWRGRFMILCAILRQLHLVWLLTTRGEAQKYDLFIIDLLPFCVPILRHLVPGRILFYCHFPDQLLTERKSLLKKLYRIPFDGIEQWAMGVSDVIVVNSKFTQSIFLKTFPTMGRVPDVIYPCVDTSASEKRERDDEMARALANCQVVTSINRFEKKKNVDLAIEAFAECKSRPSAKLVIAGGYDPLVAENVGYLRELQERATSLGLNHITITSRDTFVVPDKVSVIFMPSITSTRKNTLLELSSLLLYTPFNEHFGIVPLEAMLAGTPVLATNSGGPLETVMEGVTGWNRISEPSEWAKTIDYALSLSDEEKHRLSTSGIQRVKDEFSADKMGKEFDRATKRALSVKRQRDRFGHVINWVIAIGLIWTVALILAIVRL